MQLAEQANQAGTVIRLIMVLLTLVIAALFVGNMLSRSVAERRLELATLKAIGMPGRTIVWAIAGEALLVCGAAYFVGIGISLFFGYLINEIVANRTGSIPVRCRCCLIRHRLCRRNGTGAARRAVPARQAIRVEPVEVLREA